jgi:uncharacterized protein YdhG (YjbR/CyaY superfamily)
MARRSTATLPKVDGDRRAALAALRKTIQSIVPCAEQCIRYGLPAFRADGEIVAGFRATAKGCSYPFSGATLRTLAADLRGYKQTKSALHFRPDHPLAASLVRKLIKTRIAETGSPGSTRSSKRRECEQER